MCQLPCKPPQKSFLPHGYRFYFSLPQASKDVPGCLSLCHLPGHHWKSTDCRHSAAVPQGGETGPSSGRLTETAQTRLVWTQQNPASPGQGRGVPTQLLLQDWMGTACIFQWGDCHSCFWSWLLRGWHGVKGHNSILKLAPLKNPNTIKRHIPEAKNNHKTRHFLRHEGRGQELWGYKSLCEGAVRRLCGKGCGCKALAVCLVRVPCPRPSISTEQWCGDTGSAGLGLSQDIQYTPCLERSDLSG